MPLKPRATKRVELQLPARNPERFQLFVSVDQPLVLPQHCQLLLVYYLRPCLSYCFVD